MSTLEKTEKKRKEVVLKVGMVGDTHVGKTSLMVKYVKSKFNEDYIQTLGVNFLEKVIPTKKHDVVLSIWDLGGHKDYLHMLPLVCNDAYVILFMFDLTRRTTLTGIRQWYKDSRKLNKQAIPFLIGTKYDSFVEQSEDTQKEITKLARKFAERMKAPLVFCSAAKSINVNKIFKIVFCKIFKLKCTVKELTSHNEPIVEYKQTMGTKKKEPKKKEDEKKKKEVAA